jgi:hypothetical protein
MALNQGNPCPQTGSTGCCYQAGRTAADHDEVVALGGLRVHPFLRVNIIHQDFIVNIRR